MKFQTVPRVAKTVVPAALAISVSLITASPALAAETNANVVPGADQSSIVVHTDSNLMTVKVNAANAAAENITGVVTNTSDKKFICAGVRGDGDTAGDVATAQLVAKSEDYYRKNTFRELPKVPVSIKAPLIGDIKLSELDLGSLGPLLQGFGGVLGDSVGERKKIASDYSDERVKGHIGLIDKFVVEPNGTKDFSAYLNRPSSGPRTDFDAAAFLMCTDETNTPYVFTGYEDGTRKPGDAFFGSPGLPSLPSPGVASPGVPTGKASAPKLPGIKPANSSANELAPAVDAQSAQ